MAHRKSRQTRTRRTNRSIPSNAEQTSNQNQGVDWTYLVAGTLFAAAGGYLVYRGITAYGETNSGYYDKRDSINNVEVKERITVDKPVGELYGYWRNLENLGSIMTHLETVRELGGERSRWVAKGPLGTDIEWDAVITDDRQDELIAWRSVEGADIPNEGAVRFSPAGRNNESTEVIVSLTYHPPGGQLGAAVAKLLGQEPAQQIRGDLKRFKDEVESGKVNTSSYQTTSNSVSSTAQNSPMLGHEAGTPSLGVPGSSSGLRTDNVATGNTSMDSLGTSEDKEVLSSDTPKGNTLSEQPHGEATGYADKDKLTTKSQGISTKKSGNTSQKN